MVFNPLFLVYCLAVANGALLGFTLVGYAIFQTKTGPRNHFLRRPALVIGTTCGMLINGYLDERLVLYVTLAETIVNIWLVTLTVEDEPNSRK